MITQEINIVVKSIYLLDRRAISAGILQAVPSQSIATGVTGSAAKGIADNDRNRAPASEAVGPGTETEIVSPLVVFLVVAGDNWTWEVGQRFIVDDRAGIALDQRLGHFFAADFGSSFLCG